MQRKDSFRRRSRLHLNKKRLRYVFTVQDVQLSCGSAVLMPASAASQPSVTLTWKSGKKLALGGVALASRHKKRRRASKIAVSLSTLGRERRRGVVRIIVAHRRGGPRCGNLALGRRRGGLRRGRGGSCCRRSLWLAGGRSRGVFQADTRPPRG